MNSHHEESDASDEMFAEMLEPGLRFEAAIIRGFVFVLGAVVLGVMILLLLRACR